MRRMPEPVASRLALDLDQAAAHVGAGEVDAAWALLEEAHVLSRPWAWPHVRVHVAMLRLGLRLRDRREIRGQVLRTLVAAPGSLAGRYPLGSTGRARVAATKPMPVRPELADLLALGASR